MFDTQKQAVQAGLAEPTAGLEIAELKLSRVPERLKLASGLFNLMRNLGGAIGIAACGTILNDRTNLHFRRLAEHLTTANPAVSGLLQHLGTIATAASGDRKRAMPRRWSCCACSPGAKHRR